MAQIYKKKNGEWAYRIYYRDSRGKRHSINDSHFKKKSDAQNAARSIEMKKSKIGISRERELITFDNYFKEWFRVYKQNRYSKSTQQKYSAIRKFIHNYFGNTKLKSITKADYQKMLDTYAKTHVKTTVAALNGTIRASLRNALEEQIIPFDFTRDAIITSNKSSKDIKYFEVEEAYRIRDYCLKHASMSAISKYEIALSLATGMRYGEIIGLTWEDIDFDKNTIDINKTYDYKYRTGFKPTKTHSSIRKLDIDPITAKMLKNLKHEQKKLFLKQKFQNKDNLVFINSQHHVPSDGSANMTLNRLQTKLDIKPGNHLTFHALRHTHASILISRNVSLEYVSARLGHSSTLMTSKVYVHLLKDKKEQDAQKTVKIFG